MATNKHAKKQTKGGGKAAGGAGATNDRPEPVNPRESTESGGDSGGGGGGDPRERGADAYVHPSDSAPTEPVSDPTQIPESEMAPARVDARRLEQSGPGAPGVRVAPPTRNPLKKPDEEDKPDPDTGVTDEPEPEDLPPIGTEPPGVEQERGIHMPRT